MKTKFLAMTLGTIGAVLAIVGLLSGEGLLFGFINVDLPLDLIRIPIAGMLLYAGMWSANNLTINNTMLGVGALYILMALVGMADPKLFGMLTNDFTGFDVAFHGIAGLGAVAAGMMHREHHGMHHGHPAGV
jgi:hypothetical protein